MLSACTAEPTGGRYCSVAAILIASDQNWGEEFYSRPCGHNVTMLQHLGSYSVSPGHSGDGWSLLMVNVNFCVGLRVTFLLSSSRQRSHCQAKLNFLTKEGAVVSDESGRGRPGISWQSLTEETDNSSLHFKMSWHETGLGDHPSNATRFKVFGA